MYAHWQRRHAAASTTACCYVHTICSTRQRYNDIVMCTMLMRLHSVRASRASALQFLMFWRKRFASTRARARHLLTKLQSSERQLMKNKGIICVQAHACVCVSVSIYGCYMLDLRAICSRFSISLARALSLRPSAKCECGCVFRGARFGRMRAFVRACQVHFDVCHHHHQNRTRTLACDRGEHVHTQHL